MRNWILAAGVAALTLTVPAAAQNDKGQGKGQKDRAGQVKAERGGGNDGRNEARQAGAAKPDRAERLERKAQSSSPNRGRDDSPRSAKAENRGPDRAKAADRDDRGARMVRGDDSGIVRIVRRDFGDGFFRGGRVPFDCPPGLDKKDNGCLPPGQAMKLNGSRLPASFADARLPLQYRNWYPDSDDYYFRAGDGFIYRVNRSNDLVDGLIPLFGNGYYALGDPWPQPYDFYNVPRQYRSFWTDGDDYRYRFSDGAIYRLDPTTNAVNAIVALLAGDLGVGSRLPMGYDAYNVPLAYRSRYADSDDRWYRYNDGYIYQVDPTTRLITAVIDAIV